MHLSSHCIATGTAVQWLQPATKRQQLFQVFPHSQPPLTPSVCDFNVEICFSKTWKTRSWESQSSEHRLWNVWIVKWVSFQMREKKKRTKTEWHFDSKWGHSLLLWQLTALLCQSVTYFPIWCLVTVSFIFIQLWIRGRAYVVSPGAIMWNFVWEEELNAPQPRSDQQNKRVHWSCPLLIPSCLWDWEARGTKRPNSVYSG